MMKKLLCSIIILVVAGFGSTATAALSLWVDGAPAESSTIMLDVSDTVMIGLYNDGSVLKTIGYLTIDGGPGSWTGAYAIHNPPATGHMSTYAYLYAPINGWVFINADASIFGNDIGILAEFEFHIDSGFPGQVQISYFDSSIGLMDTLVIHVPEPISIGLLGLGALALRRRKR